MSARIRMYGNILRELRTASALEKNAEFTKEASDLAAKTVQNCELFGMLKQAAVNWSELGKPLAWGLGLAAPAAAGGAYVAHRTGEEARETTKDIRNKALQTAGGLAALGGGLYGMHRLTQKPKEQTSVSYGFDPEGNMKPMNAFVNKTASVNEAQATPEMLLEKIATVGYLDAMLEHQEKVGATEQIKNDATACRALNAEHGVDLFNQLLG